jgi:hypothetical protein
MHVHIHTHTHTRTHTHTHAQTHTHIYGHTYACKQQHVGTCTRTHKCTQTHTYIYTPTPATGKMLTHTGKKVQEKEVQELLRSLYGDPQVRQRTLLTDPELLKLTGSNPAARQGTPAAGDLLRAEG